MLDETLVADLEELLVGPKVKDFNPGRGKRRPQQFKPVAESFSVGGTYLKARVSDQATAVWVGKARSSEWVRLSVPQARALRNFLNRILPDET